MLCFSWFYPNTNITRPLKSSKCYVFKVFYGLVGRDVRGSGAGGGGTRGSGHGASAAARPFLAQHPAPLTPGSRPLCWLQVSTNYQFSIKLFFH